MNTTIIMYAAYAVRLSFLGSLSKHRINMPAATIQTSLRWAAASQLKSAFAQAIEAEGFSEKLAETLTEDFGTVAMRFIDQLAKEASRVAWARRLGTENVSFVGRVSDGRNSRLFDDMILLCAEEVQVIGRAAAAWELATTKVDVTHHGETFTVPKMKLADYLSELSRLGVIHPKSSVNFSPF